MAKAENRFPPLGATVLLFVLALFALLIAGAAVLVNQVIAARDEAALATAVEARGRGLETTFMRSLYETWAGVEALAGDIGGPREVGDLRARLDALTAGSSWIAWAGYAGLDGTVEQASGGHLEGASVAARPWFSQGLNGPYAGDLHDAVLLSERLGGTAEQPLRFLDLAAPVPDAARRNIGVLGTHIDHAAAQARFRETAQALGVEAFLVGGTGEVVIAPEGVTLERLDTPSLRAARVGASRPFVETWPDGARYMTVVLTDPGYGDLPTFGWSLAVRMPADGLASDRAALLRTIAIAAGAGLLAILVLTLIYLRLYTRPITKMAESAAAIAAGEDVYPYESRRTREVATLSAAVATLQTRVGES